MQSVKSILGSAILALVVLAGVLSIEKAMAVQTTPYKLIYNGHLLDADGDPITTSHSVRFSFWSSTDYLTGDTTATGAIDIGAANYAGWTEVHTVTPNSDGYFSVQLGSITALPDFASLPTATLLSMFLQVEVKASASADTAYELMDLDTSDDAVDRSAIASVPFALNADLLDQREVGTGSGDIALLGSGGVFDTSLIPEGTNYEQFIIDFNDTSTGDITLQFGTTVGETLVYSQSNSQFEFSDTVRIEGNLTVTGLINGIDITSLASDAQLRVSSGAGLTVDISSGVYRLNGVATNYAATSGNAVVDASTNYVFFTSTGLTINQSGFPTTQSYIGLAEVTTAGGVITGVADRRATLTDDREHIVEKVLHPLFDGSGVKGDGSDNVGRLLVAHDDTNLVNYYNWASTVGSLQDFSILVPVSLPDGFVSWEDPSITLDYRTDTADSSENKVEIEVFDTAGTAVTLSGSTTNLASTAWDETRIEFLGSPTWTAGEDFLVRIKAFSHTDNEAHIGKMVLRFRELEP